MPWLNRRLRARKNGARQAAWRLEGLAEADAGIVRVSEVLGALGTARRAATAAAASQEARQEVARAAQALAQRSLCPAATAAAEAVLGRADCGASVGGGGMHCQSTRSLRCA